MSLFRKQRFNRQPARTPLVDWTNPQSSNIKLTFSAGAPNLRTNIGSKGAAPGGIAYFGATDNSFQFQRNLPIQNGDAVTVQMLLYVPTAPTVTNRVFSTRGTANGDGNRRGWEMSLDGGSLVEGLVQVFDSGGGRTADQLTTGYSGADIAGQVVLATIQVVRTPATSTAFTLWLKTRILPETTGTVTIAVPFGDDTPLANFPEICGSMAFFGGGAEFQVLGFVARTGLSTTAARQAFYSNPWQTFVDPARLPLTDAPAAGGNVTGTFASALANLAMAATGSITDVGAFASTLGNLTMAASGSVGAVPTGTFASTLDNFVMAATGTINDTGAFASTLGGITMAASGTVAPNITGTFASTLDGVSMLASGFVGTPPVFTGAVSRRHLRPRLISRPQL